VILASAPSSASGHQLRRVFQCLVLAGSGSLASGTLYGAQSPPSAEPLEEVLVTARRRVESYTSVPMSLTPLDGETLDGLQYRRIDDILGFSPGVQIYTGADGVSSQIVIRGVLTPGSLIEPGNAVYIDEVYASGLHTILPGFYDLASVQVLKGPQPGLYGRNTTGGAVVITTGQPTDEQSARLDTSYAQYGDYDLNGTVNVPVSDVIRLRATGWYNDHDGGYYQSGVDGDKIDSWRETGGRLTLALLPNEQTTLTLSGEYVEVDNAYAGFAGVVRGAQLAPPPLAPESRRNVLRDDLGGPDQDTSLISGKLEVDTDAGSLVAVAGWHRLRLRVPRADEDGNAYAASYADFVARGSTRPYLVRAPQVYTLDDTDETVNAEVRFLTPDTGSPLQAIVGVSYFQESVKLNQQVLPTDDFALILADVGQYGSSTQHTKLDTRSWAGFTELLWRPRDTLELTADLRYTRDRKDIDYVASATGFYSSTLAWPSYTLDTGKTFDNWSPGITLAYKPDNALTLFAKYVRGFRAGGFNAQLYSPAYQSYDSEKAENYELGAKALLLDGRLELGASAFYLRLNNALMPVRDTGPGRDLIVYDNTNLSETTGLEVDLTARVTEGLSLSASGGAYHNSLSQRTPAGLNRFPFVPEYTASLAADYEHPLADAVTGIARLGFRYRHGGLVVAPNGLKLDPYHLLDAQLGVRFAGVELAAFVRNALDDRYVDGNYGLVPGQGQYVIASGLDVLTTRALVRDPGRVLGVRATVTF